MNNAGYGILNNQVQLPAEFDVVWMDHSDSDKNSGAKVVQKERLKVVSLTEIKKFENLKFGFGNFTKK